MVAELEQSLVAAWRVSWLGAKICFLHDFMGCCTSRPYRTPGPVPRHRPRTHRPWRDVFLNASAHRLVYGNSFSWEKLPRIRAQPRVTRQQPRLLSSRPSGGHQPNEVLVTDASARGKNTDRCSSEAGGATFVDNPGVLSVQPSEAPSVSPNSLCRWRAVDLARFVQEPLEHINFSSSSDDLSGKLYIAENTQGCQSSSTCMQGVLREHLVPERNPTQRLPRNPPVSSAQSAAIQAPRPCSGHTPEWRRWLRDHEHDSDQSPAPYAPPVVRRLEFSENRPP
jgi:hypothetical protein